MTISLAEARRIALRTQGLADEVFPFGNGKEGMLKTIQHLGYIQVDTISVVQRAHHHVLWSRVPDYRPELLHEMHEIDRTVFEYWNHAASYLPMSDYRFALPLMRRFRGQMHWSDDSADLKEAMRRMLFQIRRRGPLLLRDVESRKFVGGWSNVAPSKIEKRALHELWMRGQVMIRSRQGFQKVFDLPERVLPDETDQTMPTKKETAEFHVRRALRAQGVARLSELHYLQDATRSSEVKATLERLVKTGQVVELRVAEHPEIPCFVMAEALELAGSFKERRVHILSPFDNFVIQRARLRWLFGFDYTIECYVPAAKRRYGYFVLPLLWGEEFVGRMDAKADRAKRKLIINNLFVEETFTDFASLSHDFKKALEDFTRFQDCDDFVFRKVTPSKAKQSLRL